MTTKTQVLLPCPFCKADGENLFVSNEDCYHYVVCDYCGVQGPYVDYTDEEHLTAEEVWNRRCK